MPRVKATFLLPLHDNDGVDLAPLHREVFRKLHKLFGEWSVAGKVRGAYQRGGKTDIDDNVACFLVLDEAKVPKLEKVLSEFKAKTKQEAIYLELVHHVEVRLL